MPGANSDVTTNLLEAASEILARDGIGALSVRRIAEAAGCSTMAIYSHFGGKSGLYDALAQQGFERLLAAQTDAQAAAGGGPEAELHAICEAQRTVAIADPLRYRLMFGALTDLGEAARRSASESIDLIADALDRIFDGADNRGRAELVFACCHGVISAELAGVLEPDDGRLRAAVDGVLS